MISRLSAQAMWMVGRAPRYEPLQSDEGPAVRSRRSAGSSSARSIHSRDSGSSLSYSSGSFSDSIFGDAQETAPSCPAKVANSNGFSVVVTAAICLNAGAMTYQADHPVWQVQLQGATYNGWLFFNTALLLFFVVELAVRIAAFGCLHLLLHKDEWAWNLLDMVVVALGCLDLLLYCFVSAQKHDGGVLFLLRIFRVLRVLRVARIFQMKKLRVLVRGLLESFSSVLWIALFLAEVMFISAIFTTMTLGRHADDWPEDEQESILKYWGSVAASMLTLFQFLTLDDWVQVYDEVTSVKPWMICFFLPYVIFVAFVVMSALTGVMADHVNEVRRVEEEQEKRKRQEDFEAAIDLLEKVFHEKVDRSGRKPVVNCEAFASLFSSSIIRAELELAGVEISEEEAPEIFGYFDLNGDGQVSWEEFVGGMDDLHRGLTSKQFLKLTHSFRSVAQQVCAHPEAARVRATSHSGWTEKAERQVVEADEHLGCIERRLDNFEAQVKALTATYKTSRLAQRRAKGSVC